MSAYTDMRKKSLDFRRLSSNLLTSTKDDADVNLARFAKFIDADEFIHNLIHGMIDDVEYDFKNCFRFDQGGWADTCVPVDEKEHLKAQYDLIQYILSEKNVLSIAMKYPWKENKFNVVIQDFLSMALKPMIDFITDSMSKEMIIMEESLPKTTSLVQNINTVQGNAIQQTGSGTINATANFSSQAEELTALIDKLMPMLDGLEDISDEDIESVKDDMESLKEQAVSDAPKVSRMKKALAGIKKFGSDVLVKLSVSLASSAILKADWAALIDQAEKFIAGFLN